MNKWRFLIIGLKNQYDRFQLIESVKEQYRQMIAQADEGIQQKENKEQEI